MDTGERRAPTPAPAWDDEMWEELWERTLSQVERHRLAVAVLRREVPGDALARRVVPELARQWRRRCVTLAIVWGLFAGFWVMTGVSEIRVRGESLTALPWWMATIGAAVVVSSLLFRHHVAPVARHDRRPR